MTIARKQNIQTDMGAMLALCEKTQNDIRSCLSLLHYFKSQNRPVRLGDVHQSSVGQKDMQKGLFTVWQEIFQIQKSKGLVNVFNDIFVSSPTLLLIVYFSVTVNCSCRAFTEAAAAAVNKDSQAANSTPEVKGPESSIAARYTTLSSFFASATCMV